jgi:UDP-glucose 4-epimerase
MKILVVGGAGYVGSHCVRRLLDNGHSVTVYDDLSAGHREAIAERATLVVGDVGDQGKLQGVFDAGRFDAVMHFAAFINVGESVKKPLRYWRNNVGDTLVLLETMEAHNVKRFIFSSTCAVHGEPEKLPIVETLPRNPVNPYGNTKYAVELMLEDSAPAWGLGSVSLRYFNASGAHPDGDIGEDHDPETHLIPLVLQVALGQRESIDVYGTDYPTPDGSCLRDFIHVEDLADVHLRAVEGCEPGKAEHYNVGTGQAASVLEVIEAARAVTGHPIPTNITDRRPGDPPALYADASAAKARFGWEAKQRDIREVIASAWKWHQSHPRGFSA